MLRNRYIILVVFCSIVTTACHEANQQSKDQQAVKEQNEKKFEESAIEEDIEFIMDALTAGLVEVQLAQIAQQKGYSPKVKEFGSTMIADHAKANDELKQLASKKGVKVPQGLSEKDQDEIVELSKKVGPAFDKAYMNRILKDHEKDINRFQKEAETGKDPEIKAFATGKLPNLLQHLQFATSINNSIQENKL